MWIFTSGGLLMPSTFPADKVPAGYLKPGYDLQVRARVRRHLENFCNEFMAPGTFSDIQATPGMDYNFRFYCSHDDFAWAMGKAIAAIDYHKFKPTAEKVNDKKELVYGPESVEYHAVLNSMWTTITRLGKPGGWWAPWSTTNPKGYRPAEYSSRYTTGSSLAKAYNDTKITADTSMFSDHLGYNWADLDDQDLLDYDLGYKYDSREMDWTPTDEEEAQFILDDLKKAQIPTSEWRDSCTEDEWIAIRSYFDREVRREKREAKRARRRAARHHSKRAA